MIFFDNLARLLYISRLYGKDDNFRKQYELLSIVGQELSKPIDIFSESGIIDNRSDPHPNRDPKTGKFAPKGGLEHAPKDYAFQSEKALRNGIRKDLRQIDIHSDKLKNPKKYITDWEQKSAAYQAGCIKHWQTEIKNFHRQIQFRENELKRREKNGL